MIELSQAALLAGLVLAIPGLLCTVFPAWTRKHIREFPRCRIAAGCLTAVDIVWSAWLLNRTPLGPLTPLKSWLVVLAPVAFLLVFFFMDELLAARALGGLFLLTAAPLLDAARWHPSPFRYAVTVLAYGLAVKGMLLVLSPYLFRQSSERFMQTNRRCRQGGTAVLAVAGLLVALALTVY